MQFEFELEDFKDIVKKYYEEKQNLNVEVEILTDKVYGTGGYYDTGTTVGKVKLHGSIETMGKQVSFSKILKEEEVSEIFGELLDKEGFKLKSITYKFDLRGSAVIGVIMSASRDLEKANKNKR